MQDGKVMAMLAGPNIGDSGTSPVAPTRPYVLAFVGENENGILQWYTEKVLAAFSARGLFHKLIDLKDPAWHENLTACLAAGKPEFCFSFQGIGMALLLSSGGNMWERIGVPFISCLGDNPYHAPGLHSAFGAGKYLLFACEDFLQTYQHFMGGRALAGNVYPGYPENPLADRTPWSQRKHDIVYVKTAVDPKAFTAEWDTRPKQIRQLLYDGAARVLSGRNETVAALCAEAFADRRIHWGDRRELFLSTCSMVDRYARAVRAQRMVTALMRRDALIVGNWSHLDQSDSRAVFQRPIPADALDGMYAEARITVNTLPTVRFGLHERILAGLFAKAVVVSESTPYLQQNLSRFPSFFGLEIDKDTFEEQLNDTLSSALASATSADDVQTSAQVAQELFSLDHYIDQLFDHLALQSYCSSLNWWTFPPSTN